MGLHRFFHGNRTQCARYYPFAVRKLEEMRAMMQRIGLVSFSRKFDISLGDIVRVSRHAGEEYIEIKVEGGRVFSTGFLQRTGTTDAALSVSREATAFRPQGYLPDFLGQWAGESKSEVLPTLANVGDGFGVSERLEYDSLVGLEGTTTVYRTRNGQTYTELETTPLPWATRLPAARAGGARHFGYFLGPDEGVANIRFTNDGGENWLTASFALNDSQAGGYWAAQARLGPQVVWAIVTEFNTAFPDAGNFAILSEDNGLNWVANALGDIETDGNAMTEAQYAISAIRLTDAQALYTAVFDSTWYVYRASSLHGAPSRVLQEDLGSDHRWSGPNCPAYLLMSQGVPVFILHRHFVTDSPIVYVGDAIGSVWDGRAMPWPSHDVGYVQEYDEQTLMVTVFDRSTLHYELYETADLGASWQRRGTVRTDAEGPEIPVTDSDTYVGNGAAAVLQDFHSVTMLYREGRPAPTFPGQPWIGDDRITPPWEA